MTVSDLIHALGGTSATARLFGVRPSAVSNWKRSKQLPFRLHYRIAREAARRGIPVDERLFDHIQEQCTD